MKASVALSLEELTMLLEWYDEVDDMMFNNLDQKDDFLRLKLMTTLKHLHVVNKAMGEAVQTPEINLDESDLNESDLGDCE